jgi:hypothetical protein
VSEENPSSQAEQPAQSFGAAPSGQQSFGAAPAPGGQETFGSAPAGHETIGSAPAAFPPPPPTPAPGRRNNSWVRIVAALAGLAVLAGVGWFLSRGAAENAKVGSCFDASMLTEKLTDASSAKTVDCKSDKAKYRVVGIIDDKTSSELDPNVNCAPWQSAVAAIWLGKDGEKGKIFCVEDATANK